MNDWASRRKNFYLILIVFFLSAITFYFFWNFWYTAPTCFDNIKNGDETGVDCGGSCSLVCKTGAIAPIVRWDPRIFEIENGVWSAVIYVENPNIESFASYFPYKFTVYDDQNNILAEREGATILPRNKTVGIFEGGILIPDGKKPRRTVFEQGKNIVWKRVGDAVSDIAVTHTPLLRLTSAPRVEAVIKNNDLNSVQNIELVAVVFDSKDNAVATSRTFIEEIKGDSSSEVFFTWPRPFDLGEIACEQPSNVVLAIDRSGSMASISKVPTEPLDSVKLAAKYFLGQLKEGDSAALVSFANDAFVESPLSIDFASVSKAIEDIFIHEDGTQYTNIADAVSQSSGVLAASSDSSRQGVLVLLTDGIANKPSAPKSKGEADDIAYAEKAALDASNILKSGGTKVYTIGLGEGIDEDFLKSVASSPENFFNSPSTTTLTSVYEKVSSSICKELPSRIEITYKVFGKEQQ